MRSAMKMAARTLATIVVFPAVVSHAIRARFVGADGALEGSSQAIGLVPGKVGDYLRQAFYARVLAHCAPSATIQFGTLFSQTAARIEANVYIGPRCHLGWVHLERDVLVAAGVHIPSGGAIHGIDDTSVPIRQQPGVRRLVRVGEGTWIGSAAVVMADVGEHCVIGAGSVVTRPIPDYSVAAGVPAQVIRSRQSEHSDRLHAAKTCTSSF